jgi:alkaline phosphatase
VTADHETGGIAIESEDDEDVSGDGKVDRRFS